MIEDGRVSPSILIVDDDAMNRELFEVVLGTAGFQVLLSNSIESAWALLEREVPDAALVDVRLQGENDGYILTKRIKSNPRTAPVRVAVITAMESDTEHGHAKEAGADLFISRMSKMSQVIEQIKLMLSGENNVSQSTVEHTVSKKSAGSSDNSARQA